jgi:hypothetical protein
MNEAHAALADDALAALADRDTQRQAARMAQDAFAAAFRLTFSADGAAHGKELAELAERLRNWSAAGGDGDGTALRLALLVGGIDQWGVAYSQAFGLAAIPGATELVGSLRTALDPQAEARFARQFAAIDAVETDAIDFKVELRRGIHLALWHAMIASEDREEALRIGDKLGALMLALTQLMPQHGWRLLADALAHIQIRCLAEGLAATGLAQETTQGLFEALSQALPKATRDRVFAHAAQAVLAWQQARRPAH